MGERSDRGERGTRVYVGGLANSVKKEDLEAEFEKYGKLNSVWVAFNPPGFAFIEFVNKDEAENACDGLNGTELLGSKLRVELSRDRGRNRRGFRGSRGGPRGGGFSRGGFRGGDRGGSRGFRGGGRGRGRFDDFGSSRGGGYRRDYEREGGRSGGFRDRRDGYGGGGGGGSYENSRYRSRSPVSRGGR